MHIFALCEERSKFKPNAQTLIGKHRQEAIDSFLAMYPNCEVTEFSRFGHYKHPKFLTMCEHLPYIMAPNTDVARQKLMTKVMSDEFSNLEEKRWADHVYEGYFYAKAPGAEMLIFQDLFIRGNQSEGGFGLLGGILVDIENDLEALQFKLTYA